jgi:hypothetical protein
MTMTSQKVIETVTAAAAEMKLMLAQRGSLPWAELQAQQAARLGRLAAALGFILDEWLELNRREKIQARLADSSWTGWQEIADRATARGL